MTDTGIGLSTEQQQQLFIAFNQTDNSTTRKYGGTGLGLSISQDLIKMMGGTIGVNSQVGFGSHFHFTLTLDIQKIASAEDHLLPNISSGKNIELNNIYVLLVEDNAINQELMQAILSNEGIRVDIANNGIEALAMIDKSSYSLILMDCQMPVMDGFEASRIIRNNARFKDLPIIAMTANVTAEDRKRCLASGMNDHISKPIQWDTFFQTLTYWAKPSVPLSNTSSLLNKAKPFETI